MDSGGPIDSGGWGECVALENVTRATHKNASPTHVNASRAHMNE